MKDLISVIIPVYKVEKYLRRCMDSVLAQTFREIEVILVDDGSPDSCPAICDEYGAKDSRVTVIHQENAGLSEARNRGIELAKGEYLAFVDSDDYLAPDFLERLYLACVETGSDMSVCRWEYVRGEAIPERGSGETRIFTGREMLAKLHGPQTGYFVVAWNKLYKRELFEEIRYPLGKIHEDEATTYKLYDRAGRVAYVDRSLYGYFVAPVSITRGFNPKRLDWVEAVAARMDYFEEKDYRELMAPSLQAFADGSINIYFEMKENMALGEREGQYIKKLVRQGLKRVKPYGNFPLRTRIGYRLFLMCPNIYQKLLDRVKSENGKQ